MREHLQKIVASLLWLLPVVAGAQMRDLTEVSLEDLVQMEVVSASRLAQQVSDAHSAVVVVTAQDIKDHGYRTLAEILASMRGLYVSSDLAYDYLGGRGFGNPGDWAGRLLVLIDGHASNDNLYNYSYLNHAGLLDVELIDRVEYAPGTGSVLYGNNAYFGVINIFTKKGGAISATRFGADVFEHGGRKGSVMYGRQLENGADVLFSASLLGAPGQDIYFPEFDTPADNHGVAENQDKKHARRLFGKLQLGGWQFEAAYAEARTRIPNAPFGGVFNAFSQYWDTNAFVNARYDTEWRGGLKSSTHVYSGYYRDRSAGVYPVTGLWQENNRGQWWGMDQKLAYADFRNHRVVLGAEYRNDFRMDFDTPFAVSTHGRRTASLYAQDEITLDAAWIVNIGARYDHGSDVGGNLSPRVALTWMPDPRTTVRASYSTAFRMPAAFEKYYADGDAAGAQVANRHLGAEKIVTTEVVLKHHVQSDFVVTGTVYRYRTHDLIATVERADGTFQNANAGDSRANGAEIELEKIWATGARLRASHAWQGGESWRGLSPINAPRHLAKLNLGVPLWGSGARAGLEMQYVGPRLTTARRELGGYTLANLTVSADKVWRDLDVSVTVRNLFDRDYHAVAPNSLVMDSLEMEGRSGWVHLEYGF